MKFDKIKIFAPDHRLYDWTMYCEMVFCAKKVEIIKKLEEIKEKDIVLIDQTYLEFLKNFCNSNVTFIAMMGNGYIDYLFYRDGINKSLNINFAVVQNFDKKLICLNNFNINKLNQIKFRDLKNISLKKKIKFFYPSIWGIYNLLKNYRLISQVLFKKKIIFCGRYSIEDSHLEVLKKKHKFSELSLQILREKKFEKNIGLHKKINLFKKILAGEKFKKIPIYEKYVVCQSLFRLFLFSHLKNFKNFIIMPSKKLDVLRTNIYKNLIHINLNSQVGNSKIMTRSLCIEKFYPKNKIDLFFFKNNKDYIDTSEFSLRAIKVCNFLQNIVKLKNFSCKTEYLKVLLIKYSEQFLVDD
jgi:hypothetical protein